MAWKIERWLAEIFPGKGQIYAEYRALPPRELAIVAAAVLDVALAELLSLRLMHIGNEAEEFLGANGDGRAPAGSLGARIQLSLLVGLLTPEDAAILRTIKELRNLFAHRVRLTFLSPQVLKVTNKLHRQWVAHNRHFYEGASQEHEDAQMVEIAQYLPTVAEAGEGLVLSVFSVYQAYFHRMHSRIERITDGLGPIKPQDLA